MLIFILINNENSEHYSVFEIDYNFQIVTLTLDRVYVVSVTPVVV